MTRLSLTLVLAATLVACKGGDTDDTGGGDPFDAFEPADLTDPVVVVEMANNASAPNAYTLAVLFGAALENEDGTCPTRSETDGSVTYTGGCTDSDGDVWVGSAVVNQTGESSGVITYEGLGVTSTEDCDGGGTVETTELFDGTVTISEDGSFEIDMTGSGTDVDAAACTGQDSTFAIEYSGSQVEESDAVTRWSGQGRFGTSLRGMVEMSTADEITDDDGCSSEAESGSTTMSADGHEVVITYDGATDCDPESTVTWTLDGADQGELEGVECGTGFGASAMTAGMALLLVLGLRRRRE